MTITAERGWLKYINSEPIYVDNSGNYYQKSSENNNKYHLIIGNSSTTEVYDDYVKNNMTLADSSEVFNKDDVKDTNFYDVYFIESNNTIITHGHEFGPGANQTDEKVKFSSYKGDKSLKILLCDGDGNDAKSPYVNSNVIVNPNGSMTVGANPEEDMDVATKQYVDNKIKEISGLQIKTGTIKNNLDATGPQIRVFQVKFDTPFKKDCIPRVYLTIHSATIYPSIYKNMQLTVAHVSESGFFVEVITDSSNNNPWINWMAIYDANSRYKPNSNKVDEYKGNGTVINRGMMGGRNVDAADMDGCGHWFSNPKEQVGWVVSPYVELPLNKING